VPHPGTADHGPPVDQLALATPDCSFSSASRAGAWAPQVADRDQPAEDDLIPADPNSTGCALGKGMDRAGDTAGSLLPVARPP
jgi:hypothetical protein